MQTLRISAKGQITLPKRICKALDLSPGDRVLLGIEDKCLVLRGLGPATAKELAGSLAQYGKGPASLARPFTRKKVARAAAQEG